jgi:3-oxoacyl-[acyl-carrier protein] reductase
MTLQGKTAIVTGGARGIGAAIARRLGREGADVALTYSGSQAAAEAIAAEIVASGRRAVAIRADAGDAASQRAGFEQAAQALGGFDIVVHNAGVASFAHIEQDSDEAFRKHFAVNVEGVHVGTRAALPHLRDGGRIIVVGSVVGHRGLVAGNATYSSTKSAVAGLVRGWAYDLAPRGILVNTVQPGPIDTDMNPADGEFAAAFTSMVPLGRYGKVDEIAGVVAFLAGPDASYITGTSIDVAGGVGV